MAEINHGRGKEREIGDERREGEMKPSSSAATQTNRQTERKEGTRQERTKGRDEEEWRRGGS